MSRAATRKRCASCNKLVASTKWYKAKKIEEHWSRTVAFQEGVILDTVDLDNDQVCNKCYHEFCSVWHDLLVLR